VLILGIEIFVNLNNEFRVWVCDFDVKHVVVDFTCLKYVHVKPLLFLLKFRKNDVIAINC